MAYSVPRALVKQEFTQLPVFSTQPLPAFIIGPQYSLFRYAEADERADTAIGAYVAGTDTAYSYPNKPVGSVIDTDYVKVFFETAKAQYFPLASLGTVASGDVVTVDGAKNQVTFSNVVLTTANGVDRNAVFSNRDVKVGDIIQLTGATSGALTSKIKKLVASKSTLVVGTATADAANPADQAEDINDAVAQAAGTVDADISWSVAATTNYNGHLEKGIISDTYYFECTTGGNVAASRWTITTLNNAFGAKTNVACTSGVLFLDTDLGNVVKVTPTLANGALFVVGQKYSFEVKAAFDTDVVPTGGTTYTGTKDITYKITVTRGGPFYTGSNGDTCARVSVTSNGVDSSGQVNVTANTFFTVGSYGFQAKFATSPTETGLLLNTSYYIGITASVDAGVTIVETVDTLPAFVGTITAKLFLVKSSVEIPLYRNPATDDKNWLAEAAEITIEGDVAITDPLLVSADVPVDLEVVSATQFVQYRALETTNATSIQSVSTVTAAEAKVGLIHVDNPIGQALFEAITNAAGVPVYFITVATDNLAGYQAALDLAKLNNVVYGIVPLTFDKAIQDIVVAHVNALSTPEEARWRVTWLSSPLVTKKSIYTLVDDTETNLTGYVIDDPDTTGTQYTKVVSTGAKFITNNIRAGDQLLVNFRQDASGKTISDAYTIGEVKTETILILSDALSAGISSAQPVKIEIQRVYTKDEQIDNLAAIGAGYANRRVRMVFPDTVKTGSVTLNGYHVAAALAGLRSGVVPHQPLTNIQILGFDDTTKSVSTFTETQLNRLAENGFWIVTQSVAGATAYSRHQLTTDMSSVNTSEDSITTNVDSLSYGLQKAINPFIGSFNINPHSLILVRNAMDAELSFRLTNTFTVRAGNQLLGYNIDSIAADPVFKDRANAKVTGVFPAPYNQIALTLVVT